MCVYVRVPTSLANNRKPSAMLPLCQTPLQLAMIPFLFAGDGTLNASTHGNMVREGKLSANTIQYNTIQQSVILDIKYMGEESSDLCGS